MIVKTPHIEADEYAFGDTVLMPGDPLRSKYIADNFLENVVMINNIRNIGGYTGSYKGHKISVMASGMGMPSMGIYSYELFKFFNVKNIIRIGSSGSLNKDVKVNDVILANEAYTESNIALTYGGVDIHNVKGSEYLTDLIYNTAIRNNIKVHKGTILTSDFFDEYTESKTFYEKNVNGINLGCEMETFMLFYIAKRLNKNASSLLTVSDSIYEKIELTAAERQETMNSMIKLALDASIEIGE